MLQGVPLINKKSIAQLLWLIPLFLFTTSKISACENRTKSSKCVQVSVQDKAGEAVADIVVYLQPLAGQKLSKTTDVVTILQHKQTFSPYISVSQKGNDVNFHNKDDITHHIYSVNKKGKFSFKIKAESEHISEPFLHESEVAMGCNIHDWMSGSLLIVDTPYFGKTDINGSISFSIEALGKYQITAWHPQLPMLNHRLSQEHNIINNVAVNLILPQDLKPIPTQLNDDDDDFISDY